VIGSVLGRTTNAQTVAAIDAWVPVLRRLRAEHAARCGELDPDHGPSGDGRVIHRCPDGFTSIVALAEVCDGCGWSPSLPLPMLDDCADALVFALGWDDALLWARALVCRLEGR